MRDRDALRARMKQLGLGPVALAMVFDDHDWLETFGRVLYHDLAPADFDRRTPPPGPERRRLFGLLKARDPVRVFKEAPMAFDPVLTLPDDGAPGVSARDRRLLLQTGTDEKNSDGMWGDGGTLYGRIPAEDAPAGRFDRVVARAQCC